MRIFPVSASDILGDSDRQTKTPDPFEPEVGEVDCTTDEEEIREIVGEGGTVTFVRGSQ